MINLLFSALHIKTTIKGNKTQRIMMQANDWHAAYVIPSTVAADKQVRDFMCDIYNRLRYLLPR